MKKAKMNQSFLVFCFIFIGSHVPTISCQAFDWDGYKSGMTEKELIISIELNKREIIKIDDGGKHFKIKKTDIETDNVMFCNGLLYSVSRSTDGVSYFAETVGEFEQKYGKPDSLFGKNKEGRVSAVNLTWFVGKTEVAKADIFYTNFLGPVTLRSLKTFTELKLGQPCELR